MKTLVLYDIDGETLTDLKNIQNDLATKYKNSDETFIGSYDMFVLNLPYYNHLLDDYDSKLQLFDWYDDYELVTYISKILDMLSGCDALLLPKDFGFNSVYRIIYNVAKEYGYHIDAINSDGKRICINFPD